jgi:ribosomal protein L37AE/L43A
MSDDTINTIERLLVEAEMIKNKRATSKRGKINDKIWNNNCDEIVSKLQEIRQLYEYEPKNAISKFRALDIYDYPSFGNYIKHNNIVAADVKFSTTAKQTRKKKCCPNCFSTQFEYDNSNGIYICSVCKTNISKKQNNQLVTKDTNNESKHIIKQINIICGRVNNAPAQVNKIMPFIKEWFINRSHIYDWLIFSGRYQAFIDKYYEEENIKIDESFFKEQIKYGIENLCSYAVFKMFTDEFYALTDRVRTYNAFNSNILRLPVEQQLGICQWYVQQFGQQLPPEDYKIQFGNELYELGTYIIYWKINDIHFENPVHQQLNQIFGQNIILPGLIFEYPEICGAKGKILQKYNYQQNYVFIIKDVYKIELIDIIEEDKQNIIDLMLDFNNFVKQLKSEESNSKHNSCLWHVVLMLILKMPYYRCYSNIIPILPIKSIMTTLEIQEHWSFYQIIKKEKLKPYMTTLRTKIDKSTTSKTIISKGEVNINNVFDFINGKGQYYGADKEDKYLEEKLHIQEKNHNWANEWAEQYESGLESEIIENMNTISEEMPNISNDEASESIFSADINSEENSENENYSNEDNEYSDDDW